MNISQLLFVNRENLVKRSDSPDINNKALDQSVRGNQEEFSSHLEKELSRPEKRRAESYPEKSGERLEKSNDLQSRDGVTDAANKERVRREKIEKIKELKNALDDTLENYLNNNKTGSQGISKEIKELKSQLEDLLSKLSEHGKELDEIVDRLALIAQGFFNTKGGSSSFGGSENGLGIGDGFSLEDLVNKTSQTLQEKLGKLKDLNSQQTNSILSKISAQTGDSFNLREMKELFDDANTLEKALDKATLKSKDKALANDSFSVLQGNLAAKQNKFNKKSSWAGRLNVKGKLNASSINAKANLSPTNTSPNNVNLGLAADKMAGLTGSDKFSFSTFSSTFSTVNLNNVAFSPSNFSEQSLHLFSKSELGSSLNSKAQSVFSTPLNHSSRLDPTILQNHLVKTISNGLVRGNEVMSVQLSPAQLGSIKVIMKKESEQVHLKLLVENSSVKEILEEKLSSLKVDLAQDDVEVTSLDIDLKQDSGPDAEEQNASFELSEGSKNSLGEPRELNDLERMGERSFVNLRGQRLLNLVT